MKMFNFANTLNCMLAEGSSQESAVSNPAVSSSQSSAQATKAPASMAKGPLGMDMITYLYLGILAFFLYQMYKTKKYKKILQEPVKVVQRKAKIANYALAIFLIILGFFNSFSAHNYIAGVVMALLGFVFGANSSTPIYLAPNGILADNAFVPWSQIKRWGWNTDNGDLVVEIKLRGKPSKTSAVHVGTDKMKEVNDYIRQLKLGKE